MYSSRVKAKPSADGSNSAKRLKVRNALISRENLSHNSPLSHARNEKNAMKISRIGSVLHEESSHSLQPPSHTHEHHFPLGTQNQALFNLTSPPNFGSRDALGVEGGSESASGVLCSTPFSHPEGPPSRRLLNAFLSDSANSKVLSSPSPRDLSAVEAPKVLALSEWGLPNKVVDNYKKNGVASMFEWQAECLTLPGVLSGGNLVYSAPTSAGKTLVAELLALKCVLELRKKAVFVLPFVSIAQEKCAYLQKLFESVGVRVGSFVGNQSPAGGLVAVDIAICTIEKANSLVNRLLEESQLECLGLVVVDELHMISDPHRGYLLELLLTKVLFSCGQGAPVQPLGEERAETKKVAPIQLVGMSATLPNLDTLSHWLGAQLFRTDFRPVPLTEMVKIGSALYDTKLEKVRDLDTTESLPGDEDDILLLCRETVSQGHSVLIFCPTKNWCEKLAQAITRVSILDAIDQPGLADVCEQLKRTQVGLDPALGSTIPHGVAFHHAGLTMDEREVVEAAFRQSLIKILAATSTLSSGVNLPARLVIVRTPFFNRSLLDVLVYRQMVGRAGRKGIDSRGESILVCKPSERSKVAALLQSAPKPVRSCLGKREEAGPTDGLPAVKRAVLEVVANGMASTIEGIQRYMSCTLLFAELKGAEASVEGKGDSSDCTRALLDKAVEFLEEKEFVCRTDDAALSSGHGTSVEYRATQLGLATVASALSPDEALVVFTELCKASKSFVLENELHLVYLVTPVYIQDQWPHIDWYRYLCILERLPADMRHVADTVGVLESFLGRAVQGKVLAHTDTQRSLLWVHQRFYTALALHDLVHEVPILEVAAKYGATKGLLQSLQGAAGTFAGMTTVFCNRLGWKNMELLLSQFQNRLAFGVERELCDLVRVSLVNASRARVLYNAGFHTLASLASTNPSSVELCLRRATPFRSHHGDSEDSSSYTWCAQLRRRVTHSEAARMIVEGARAILAEELDVPASLWKNHQTQQVGISGGKSKKRIGLHVRGTASLHRKVIKSGSAKQMNRDLVRFRNGTSLGTVKGDHSVSSTEVTSKIMARPEQAEVLPVLAMDRPCAHFVPASCLVGAPPVPISLPPPTITLPSTPSFTAASPPAMAVTSVPPHLAAVPFAPAPPIHSASTPAPPMDQFDTSVSPFPSFCLPCSLDASLNLSSRALAILDAACDEEPGGGGPPTSSSVMEMQEPIHLIGESPVIPLATKTDGLLSVSCAGEPHVLSRFESPHQGASVAHESFFAPRLDYSLHQPSLQDLSALSASHTSISGITIIDVSANGLLFETFVAECVEQMSISFAVATQPLHRAKGIGTVLVGPEVAAKGIPLERLGEQVLGIAFCWGGTDVYYLPLTQDESDQVPFPTRVSAAASIFISAKCRKKLVAYNAKEHVKSLVLSCGVFPRGGVADPKVASWLLDPDAKEKTIHKMVLHYLPDQPLLTEDGQEDKLLSSVATHSTDPQVRAAAEAILSFLLMASIEPLLEAEGLTQAFTEVETPSIPVLAKMELNGIGFSPTQCSSQKSILQDRLTELERKAYSLAGRNFSLTSLEDVAQVLFVELKLPPGVERKQQRTALGMNARKRRVQHLSTAKDVLEKVAPLHPLPMVILVWRRISNTMTKVIFPLLKAAVSHSSINSVRIHATCQMHTATGRVAMFDPTLQSVPKEYDIGAGADTSIWTDPFAEGEDRLVSESQVRWCTEGGFESDDQVPRSVSMRSAFVPFPGAVFLAADYSQLELRVLAHLSGDKMLREFLNGDGDVFKMIAGQWLGMPAVEVSSTQRQHAKQVCYGMIYGIGAKALGVQLGVPEEEAARFMDSFKSKYPAVKVFIAQTIQECRVKGHITTLLSRKRFLPNIHSTNIHARSQAERQAINSRIQGSAADLVKMAMTKIDRRLTEQFGVAGSFLFASSPSRRQSPPSGAYLVLQMHDELLYEVSSGVLGDVAHTVRHEMENTMNLSVKFPVTIKTGTSWGSLKDYRM